MTPIRLLAMGVALAGPKMLQRFGPLSPLGDC